MAQFRNKVIVNNNHNKMSVIIIIEINQIKMCIEECNDQIPIISHNSNRN